MSNLQIRQNQISRLSPSGKLHYYPNFCPKMRLWYEEALREKNVNVNKHKKDLELKEVKN